MADIFISYKREEHPIAKKLADALQKKGWTVWWDPEVLTGERFHDIIDTELKESKCVVVLWSKLSVESENVKDEATYALKRKKLVPITIENVDLPYWAERINTGQLINWDGSDDFPGYQKLVSDISKIIAEEDERRRKEAERAAKKEHRLKQEEEQKRKAEEEKLRKEQEEQERKEEEQRRIEAERKTEEERKQKEAAAKRKADDEKRRKEEEELKRKAEEEERKRKEAEAKQKAEEEQKRKKVKAEIKPEKPEPTKIKPSEPRKRSNALKFGIVAGVIVLLITGVWLYYKNQPEQQKKETRIKLERFYEQVEELERSAAKVDNQEQLKGLYRQGDKLSNQVAAFIEQATKVGLRSQLAELQNRLKKFDTQLANKENKLIAGRKGRIFVASAPENANIKILNIDKPFQQGMELEPGKYNVQVSLEGYEPQDRWIDLNPGEEKKIDIELEKKLPKNIATRPVSEKEGWVNLGTYKNGTWTEKYFNFPNNTNPKSLNQTNQVVSGKKNTIHVREKMPNLSVRSTKKIDILKSGDMVKIMEVEEWKKWWYKPDSWWARIKYKD